MVCLWTCQTNLDVSGSFVRLVGDLLLHAGQLLFEVQDLILVEFCQVVQLLLQTFTPEHPNIENTHVRVCGIISLDKHAGISRNRP